MKTRKRVLALLALALAPAAQAEQLCVSAIPASTPAADFSDMGTGTVLHKPTGLVWMRCAQGQTWSGGTCADSAANYTWQQALQAAQTANQGAGSAGRTDWRLPNVKELLSIVEGRCWGPAINVEIFPNAPPSAFWSASAYAHGSGNAWAVGFFYGGAEYGSKDSSLHIRLVRAAN